MDMPFLNIEASSGFRGSETLARMLQEMLNYVSRVYATNIIYDGKQWVDEEVSVNVEDNTKVTIRSFDPEAVKHRSTYLILLRDDQMHLFDEGKVVWFDKHTGRFDLFTIDTWEEDRMTTLPFKEKHRLTLVASTNVITPFIQWLFDLSEENIRVQDSTYTSNYAFVIGELEDIHNEFAILELFSRIIKERIGKSGLYDVGE